VGTFFAMLLGVPIALLTAIFLAEVAPKRLAVVARPAVELLAGIPSVMYGLLGIYILSGALGMGATKWNMIRTILLPSALPGILTGVILAVGRIVGESAALLFTAGSGYMLPRFKEGLGENLVILGKKALESGGTLTVELYLQMQNGKYDNAFGIACVLIIIVLGINLLMKFIAVKMKG